jgi:enoyl-CoA hydratase
MSNLLETERRGNSLVIILTRPEIRNPLSVAVLDLLSDLLAELDEGIGGLIFTGTGGAFASGADLREIADLTTEEAEGFAMRGQALMATVSALTQMTIAAVNGYCFGGALDLAMACDRRVASSSAKFAHPGAGLGIITGWGGTQRLPRLVGTANALEMFFTASPIDAERALKIGLIDEIADEAVERSLAIAAAPQI